MNIKNENQTPGEYKEQKHARITIKSLASEMGISHTTISNAWNNPEKLSADLRERIFLMQSRSVFRDPIN